jgi:peroxiredoxin
MKTRTAIAALILLVLASAVCPARADHSATSPDFTLRDSRGHSVRLSALRGRPVVIWFFCGCPWCAACARQWGAFEQGGVITGGSQGPITLVVYAGNATDGVAFIQSEGMDANTTTVVGDPQLSVTEDLYHAELCPRVFVLDQRGIVRYTNDHADDKPRVASANTITSKALGALQRILATHRGR